MVQKRIRISTRRLKWKCVESRVDSKCLYYGRFMLFPLLKGQADTIAIAMRRVLLGEIEGTRITRAQFFENIPHEFSTIEGVEESVDEILMNLKKIVFRSNISRNLYESRDAYIWVKGPGYVTAQDIILPPSVEIVDNTQHIAILREAIDLHIEFLIERKRGYCLKPPIHFPKGAYWIDSPCMPVIQANHNVYSCGNQKEEMLFLEIWTNGSLTPKEALHEATRNLISLVIPFLHPEEEDLEEKAQHKIPFRKFCFHPKLKFGKKKKKRRLKSIFIDQLELTPKIYNCLKRSNIHTLGDLVPIVRKNPRKLLEIKHFHMEDVKDIIKHLLSFIEIEKSKSKSISELI